MKKIIILLLYVSTIFKFLDFFKPQLFIFQLNILKDNIFSDLLLINQIRVLNILTLQSTECDKK